MRTLFCILASAVMCCSLFVNTAYAASDFSTSFVSTYRVMVGGDTEVTHVITVKNNVPYRYLTKYTISLGSDEIHNLKVSVQGKKANAALNKSGMITDITIPITQPVIGQDQELNLTITYTTSSIAIHYGKVWEVNIPRLSRANEAVQYTRTLIVPSSFGEPQVTSPHPTSMVKTDDNSLSLMYVGFPNDSLTMLFGEKLDYELNLVYHLSNPSPSSADTELALPPDTEYQHIIIGSLDPEPKFVKLDSDGNWLAVYSLKAKGTVTVKAKLYASVYPLPHYTNTPSDTAKLTRKAKYWDVDADNIQSLARKLKSSSLMYGYVVDNLSYDYDKVGLDSERLGGSATLDHPGNAICTEFTDTFVSLSRAAGIPAREIEGYAYTAGSSLRTGPNEDFLHAWPEYYDSGSKQWIQIDPTLGKTTGGLDYFTKLDYGHIAFVIHGIESTYPYPAGSYKSDPGEKTVSVDLTDALPVEDMKTDYVSTKKGFSVKNTGNIAIHNRSIRLPDGTSTQIFYLPPYATSEVDKSPALDGNVIQKIWHSLRTLLESLFRLHS